MTNATGAALADALRDRYVIERELGRGGMATVYLAQDLKHGRAVALKVLHDWAAVIGPERFQREIELVARLAHPHILPLFDSGEAAGQLWYTMPYVEGETLRTRLRNEGRLQVAESVQIAREVADALDYAHRHDVVHRDIKPENILLEDSHAVVADFGIARAIDASGVGLTSPGMVVGTAAYMSPEQAAGTSELDGRSDQYALGCVLYEMLAGTPPFTGPTAQAVIGKRFTELAPHICDVRTEVPEAVERALERALAKDPADRFSTTGEFAEALQTSVAEPPSGRLSRRARRWALAGGMLLAVAAVGVGIQRGFPPTSRPAPTSAAQPRIVAVLPFRNLGPATDQYFADGLTEEITSRLAGLAGLAVISRSSADQYRDTKKPLKQVGRELGAAYLLEGSVRWDPKPTGSSGMGRVRITPQLIRVADDVHLWADAYEAELAEVFQLQSTIAERVAGALKVALQPMERAALEAGGTTNPEAYDYYLRGNDYLGRGTSRAPLDQARELYERAAARDPRFALAFAQLSTAHILLYWYGHDRTKARLTLAKRAADSALALVPDLPEGNIALGYYYHRAYRDYDHALEYLTAARRRRPNDADIVGGIAAVARRAGRWGEAIEGFTEALRYDPRSTAAASDLASSLAFVGRFAEAERVYDRAIALAPDWPLLYVEKAQAYLSWRGDVPAARRVITQAVSRLGLATVGPLLIANDQIIGSVFTSDTASTPLIDALSLTGFAGDTVRYYFLKMESARFRRLTEVQHTYADSLRSMLEQRLREAPDDAYHLSWAGIAYAALGRKADAIQAGRRSVELMPVSRDALAGSYLVAALAQSYMMVNEPELAVETLAPLVDIPSAFTREALRADPLWAPLRNHLKFRKLVGDSILSRR